VFLILASIVGLWSASPAGATFPGRNGRVVTWGIVGYERVILSTLPDGSGHRRLVSNEHYNRMPRFSPDGRLIVFMRDYELWLMDSHGDHRRALVRRDGATSGGAQAWWAPSGKRFVFVGNQNGALYIKVLGRRGVRPVTNRDLVNPFMPVWSPLGHRIIFTTYLGDGVDQSMATHDLWSIRPDGTGLRSVTDTDADELIMDWSPDGRWILFTRKESPGYDLELWRSHPDGSHAQQIHVLGAPCCIDPYATYSPNGRLILFDCGGGNTCVIPSDGGNPRVVGTDFAFFGQPSWQPTSTVSCGCYRVRLRGSRGIGIRIGSVAGGTIP
jgi:Tol biopolymer transport system component